MAADPLHILDNALGVVLEGVPMDKLSSHRTSGVLWIRPFLAVELRRAQIIREKIADDFAGEQLHSTVAVMDDEPFVCPEQLVRDNERTNCIIGRTATCVTNNMRITFR